MNWVIGQPLAIHRRSSTNYVWQKGFTFSRSICSIILTTNLYSPYLGGQGCMCVGGWVVVGIQYVTMKDRYII